MWEIYDALIEGIPNDIKVEEIVAGVDQAYIRSSLGSAFGISMPFYTTPRINKKNILGAPLKEIAEYIKSWSFSEAVIGQAAMNAYYNTPEIALKNGIDVSAVRYTEDRLNDPFISYQNLIKGKKVAVVGHFHYLEQLFQPVCDLSIIESDPIEGDFPSAAAEYILPEQDFVVITCSSLVDKTLPRLLEISKNAYKIVVGPTTTLSPILFGFGIDDLSSFVIKDTDLASQIANGLVNTKVYSAGQKVSLKKEDYK